MMIFSMYYMVVKNIAHHVSLHDRQNNIIDEMMHFNAIFFTGLRGIFSSDYQF